MRQRPRFHCAALVAALVALPSSAQPEAPKAGVLIGEEQRTRDELDAADRLAADGRFDDAVRRYRQVLADSGDALVSLAPGDARRAIPARWLVHRRLAVLPPAARALFTRDADEAARRQFEQAAAKRDVRLLERIVADAFITPSAEKALHLLGDLALERGEFEVAELYWRMIARPASEEGRPADPGLLIHPEPSAEGAGGRAKQILALLFRGERLAAKAELEQFRKRHPQSAGHLAGREGNYGDALQQLLDSDLHRPVSGATVAAWPTFAGRPTRNSRVPAEVTPYWPDTPSWRQPLPGDPKAKPHRDSDPPLGTGVAARSLAFHPAIVPGFVLVADAARVWAFDANSGELAAEYDHRKTAGLPKSLDLRVPSRSDACYSLTVDGGRIYARFGTQLMRPPENGAEPAEMESALVCLVLNRGPDGKSRFEQRWQVRSRLLDTDPPAAFEGAPVVQGGRLLVARSRFDGRQTIVAVECYDADSGAKGEPPARRWRQEVWSAELPADPPRRRHDLLTLAGSNVVYCTHSGLIVALDAATGRRVWAYRYPVATRQPPDGVHPRDLSPCVYAEGRIYAAPSDGDRIFCLDARTGEGIWESNTAHVVQMLGVSNGRLVVTLGGFPHGIRAYHSARGNVLWTRPDVGDLGTFGRGFLSDSLIFWPTRHGLRVLRQDDGDPVHVGSSSAPLGHLALAGGLLVVTTPTEILGFLPPRQALDERHREALERPNSAETLYRLALAQADAGESIAASETFRRAGQLAGDPSLRESCERRRAELLEHRAIERWHRRRHDEALGLLHELSSPPHPIAERVRAWEQRRLAGDTTFPDVLGDSSLRGQWIVDRDGLPRRADEELAGRLDEAGRAEWEQRALAALATSIADAAERFPGTRAVRAAVLADAQRLEREGQPWPAAKRYRQLLAGAAVEANEPRRTAAVLAAREGLIRIYSKNGLTVEARDLQRRLGQKRSDLAREPAPIEPPVVKPTPEFPVPWSATSIAIPPFRERPLDPLIDATTGKKGSAADDDGRLFCSGPRQVICRSLDGGKHLWTSNLSHDTVWMAMHAETAIVGGPNGVSRLRRADGERLWQFLPAAQRPAPTSFPEPMLRLVESRSGPPPFSAPRLAGTRLVLRNGPRQLLGLDIESGQVLWQFQAPGASLQTPDDGAELSDHYLATHDHILLQSTGGDAICLDAATGRERFRRSAPVPWTGPPILFDSHRAAYAEGPRVHAIDLDTSTPTMRWFHSPRGWPSLSGAAPQLRRDGDQLLVVTERNYGFELERLRLDTGQAERGPIFLGRDRVDLARSAIATNLDAMIVGESLIAYDREDGRHRWTIPLKPGAWQATATRSALLLHPVEATPLTDLDALRLRAARVPAQGLSLENMHIAATMLAQGWSRRTFPLIALDPADGHTLHEQTFPAAGPPALVIPGRWPAVLIGGSLELLKAR